MSDIKVRQVTVEGYTSFIASIKLVCGTILSISSSSANSAIAELEEEIRYKSSSNPNQGINFDEDEEDYYG